MDEKCKNCEDRQACVPFFMHENSMMHKDKDNRRMAIICLSLCLALVIVVVTLVAYYTSRTQMWNDTITKLTTTLAEVADGVHEQPNP